MDVRERYKYRCGYCGVTEVDCGAHLTVDHYRPLAAGGDDADDNLVYACFRCNLFKSDVWSEEEAKRPLHPLVDDAADHFRYDPSTGALEALTDRGNLHLSSLRLNRPELVRHRLREQLSDAIRDALAFILDESSRVERNIELADAYRGWLEADDAESGPQ